MHFLGFFWLFGKLVLIVLSVASYRISDVFSVRSLLPVSCFAGMIIYLFFDQNMLFTLVVFGVFQLLNFGLCHQCWEIRKTAYDATRKIIAAAPQLAETLLLEFSNFLSLSSEKLFISKTRYINDTCWKYIKLPSYCRCLS